MRMSGEENTDKQEQLCPKIEPVHKETIKLGYEEKLKLIEDEAHSLYAFCMEKGFSPAQMHTCVSMIRGPPKPKFKKAFRDSFSGLFILSLIAATAYIAWNTPSLNNLLIVHAKLFSVKYVLPYWNWASLYNEDCMISNHWLPEPEIKIDKKFCSYCIDVVELGKNTIDRLDNTDGDEITKHYISTGQPVVVTDTTKDWQQKKKLTMDELAKMYQNDPLMSTVMGSCNYSTNVGFNETFYDFFTAYVDKNLPEKWHANWQNCETKAGKVIRRFYARPYFLPGMAQSGTSNSIITSKGQHGNEWFEVSLDQSQTGHWITVVSGGMKVQLIPNKDCQSKFKCQVAEVELNAGEAVFFTAADWEHKYAPIDDGMTMAIASSVLWDELAD